MQILAEAPAFLHQRGREAIHVVDDAGSSRVPTSSQMRGRGSGILACAKPQDDAMIPPDDGVARRFFQIFPAYAGPR